MSSWRPVKPGGNQATQLLSRNCEACPCRGVANSPPSVGGHLYADLLEMPADAAVIISGVCLDRYLVSNPFATTNGDAGRSTAAAASVTDEESRAFLTAVSERCCCCCCCCFHRSFCSSCCVGLNIVLFRKRRRHIDTRHYIRGRLID